MTVRESAARDHQAVPASTTRLDALVARARERDPAARHELHRVAYPSVLRYAAHLMSGQSADHTLDAAGLANEGYVRIASRAGAWNDYGHLIAAWFQAMRHHLVDHAHARAAQKRGAGWRRGRLTGIVVSVEDARVDLITLHDALARLAAVDSGVHAVIELRFFGGRSMKEVAEATGRSLRAIEREWEFGRAWLLAELSR